MGSVEINSGQNLNQENFMERREIADFSEPVRFVIDLAIKSREVAMAKFGLYQGEARIDEVSKDESFDVDAPVEEIIRKTHGKAWGEGKMYGFVTEEQKMTLPPDENPEWIIEYDPVDGSRTAQAGDEQACFVAFGVRGDKKNKAMLQDIEFGVTLALKEDNLFVVDTTGAYEIDKDGKVEPVIKPEQISAELSNTNVVWEYFSTNTEHIGKALAPLLSSVRSGMVYPCGSYGALSVINQSKIHVDLRQRLFDEQSDRLDVVKEGTKVVKFLTPMDIGSVYFLIKKAGGVVTDGYGQSLNEAIVWEEKDGQIELGRSISWLAAPTEALHRKAIERINEGMNSLKS